ncbi:MAG: hypothetical protein JRI72_12625 [Deltaproteobacteria bacterium]|nr:hypothetical protein [Deltaproteobacteria bacterium]
MARTEHPEIKDKINELKKVLCQAYGINTSENIYTTLAVSIQKSNIQGNSGQFDLEKKQVIIPKIYDSRTYEDPRLDPVNGLHEYTKEKLERYILDAYIHGSLSSMDHTGYSDLDTLFILKPDILKDPGKIKKLEQLFIRSTRYLYRFDPLQHHGHFFLLESDLNCYNQSFLPLPAIQASTSLLGRGTRLEFQIRSCEKESEQRFLDSMRIMRRYVTQERNRLEQPYYLKGFLSHFMILPALFLQLNNEYLSKKESFVIMKERMPSDIWQCMDQVSSIRRDWQQKITPSTQKAIRLIGLWNPLLLPYFVKRFYKIQPITTGAIDAKLLDEMLTFCEYLYKMSGLDDKQPAIH